jgi:hypothetical protein
LDCEATLILPLEGCVAGASIEMRLGEQVFYPECLCGDNEMAIAERSALGTVLAQHRPQCSIVVGANGYSSIAHVCQYSKVLYSIDVDPRVPEQYHSLANVSFLQGPSSLVLPVLLDEMDRQSESVDFILVGGGQSATAIKQHVSAVLSYVPKKPMFLIVHGSFHPECRRSLSAADWEGSPFVHFIDLDWVPGRLVEHAGEDHSEMRGGLAVAYLLPVPRLGRLSIFHSAETMFQLLAEAIQRPLPEAISIALSPPGLEGERIYQDFKREMENAPSR